MSIKVDKIQLQIAIKHDKARQEIAEITNMLGGETRQLDILDKAKRKAMKKYKDENHPEVVHATAAYQAQAEKVDQLKKRKDELRRSLKIEGLSIAEVRDEIRKYNLQLSHLTPGTTAFNETKKHLDDLKARLKDLNSQSGQTKSALNKFEGEIGRFNVYGFAFTNMKEILSTVWTAVKSAAVEWYNYNKQMAEATRLTREFLGLHGKDLAGVTDAIKATADVWGKDYKETLEAVDTLTSQYGLTAQEALQIVRDGLQAGADLNGDMISKIKQYAPAFNDAGISARQLVALIQQTRSGIFSDRGMDLISMAAKRLREMEKATADSLDAVGINSSQMQQQLADGTMTMYDAIRTVSRALKSVETNSAEAGAILKDVFGRQGAAGGQEMIKALETLDIDLDSLKETTGEYGRLQQEQVETQEQLNNRVNAFFTASDGGFDRTIASLKLIGTNLLIKIMDGLIQAANYLINVYNQSVAIRTAWVAIKTTFSTAIFAIKTGLSAVWNALVGIVGLASSAVTTIEGLVTLDFAKAKKGFTDFGKTIKNFVSDVWKDFNEAGQKWGSALSSDIKNFNKEVEPVTIPVKTQQLDEVVVVGKKRRKKNINKSNKDSGSKKSSKTDDAYQQQLAREEQAYRMQGNALRQALLQRQISEEQYQQQSLDAEVRFLARKIELQQQYGKDSSDTQGQYLDKLIAQATAQTQQNQRLMQADLATLQSSYNADLINISRQQLDGQITTQQEANDKRFELEIDYQRQRLAIIRQYGGDTLQAEADLAQRELQRYQQETAAKQEAFRREHEDRIKAFTSGTPVSPGSFSAGSGSAAAVPSIDDALASLDALHNAQILSDQEFEQRRTEILQQAEQQRQDIRQAYFDQAQELMQSAASLFSALQQREESRVDQKYKRLIAAAKKSGADTSKIEEQQEAEKMAIKKKYAQKEFAMNILKILADTAVAIQGVWKEFPNPAVAIPITAMVSASSAMQLATAKMQADQAAGLYNGGFSAGDSAAANTAEGYTGDGNPRDRAGYVPVHRREFVINHRTLRQPAVMNVARIIDSYQQANRPELINATALLRSLQPQSLMQEGFAEGGFTDGLRTMSAASSPFSAGSSSAAAPHQETIALVQECRDLLRTISQERGLTILELRDRIRRQEALEQRATRQ